MQGVSLRRIFEIALSCLRERGLSKVRATARRKKREREFTKRRDRVYVRKRQRLESSERRQISVDPLVARVLNAIPRAPRTLTRDNRDNRAAILARRENGREHIREEEGGG